MRDPAAFREGASTGGGPRASSPAPRSNAETEVLPWAYAGKRVLLIGATGFLGGVTLSLLLSRCPEIGRVYVLMRRSPGLPAAQRFRDRVLPACAFDPIRSAWDALEGRVSVLQGDLSQPDLGLDSTALADLEGLDLILNCAGLVEFEAPLDQAYRTNVLGVRHLLDVARRTGAHLVHVSTCFVAGSAAGVRPETVSAGFFPRQEDAPYLDFDPEREVRDLEAELDRLARGVEEQAAQASYREQALERFRTQNAGLPAPSALANAARRIGRDDLKARMVGAGRRRAEFWGWPNVYTYSKSIGEQLIAASDGIRWSIARPAIIESALRYPEPGYNLNATTSAPLVMLALGGFGLAPARPDLVIDIVPVDSVASGLLAIGAAALLGRAEPVYQIGTSDVNPCRIDRVIELIGLYLHEREMGKKPRLLEGMLKANREPALVNRKGFEGRTRQVETLWRTVSTVAADLREHVDHPRLRAVLEKVTERADRTATDLDKARTLWDLFLPFSHDHDYRFTSHNVRKLWEALEEPHDLEALDWREYWIDVHIPGLRKHVLTESFGKQVKAAPTPVSLAERVEAVARTDPYRAALTSAPESGPATVGYGELWARAGVLAQALGEPSGGEVTIALDPHGYWIIGLLGAQRAGKIAHLIEPAAKGESRATSASRGTGATLGLTLERDGYEIRAGRRKVRGAFPTGRSATDPIGASAMAGAPAIRYAGGEPIASRDLAKAFAETGDWLALEPAESVAADSGAPPGVLLAVLQAQAELWLAAGDGLAAIVAGGGATKAIVAATVPADPGRVRAVLDLAPQAGRGRVQAFLDRKIPVVPVRAHGLGAQNLAPRSPGIAAIEPDGAPDGDNAPQAYGSLQSRLQDAKGVESAIVLEVDRTRQAFVRPDLAEFRDFRQVISGMQRLLSEINAAVAGSDRLNAIVMTLGPLPSAADPGSWEARTDWIRLTSRSPRADWSEFPEDRIPLEDLEEDTLRLLRGGLDARSADFVLAHHREGPQTYDRLVLLERVLLAMFRGGETFNAQAFLQRYEQEAARAKTLEYRLGFRVGTLVQKWRNWHASEDPEGLLLPRAVTEPVKKGLGIATNAFFDLAMDVELRGSAHVPAQGSFVVVANHSSHLDTGVIKFALGPWGERIRALAAKDYFFGGPTRRFLAHHFTRLIPTDRQAVTTEWIKRAREALGEGDCVLIFPEGTRTSDPGVGPFKASLGTLLRSCKAPVLPIYIDGTRDILPKGAFLPQGRKIRVKIGPLIPHGVLERETEASGGTLARDRQMAEYIWRAVADLAERA